MLHYDKIGTAYPIYVTLIGHPFIMVIIRYLNLDKYS